MADRIFRTEGFDDMLPPGKDERWKTFGDFHDYIAGRFPLVYGLSFAKTLVLYSRPLQPLQAAID